MPERAFSTIFSAVFAGVSIFLAGLALFNMQPGWPLLICFAVSMSVLMASFLITSVAMVMFYHTVLPAWASNLLVFVLVSQWHMPLAILADYSSEDWESVLWLVLVGALLFGWPAAGAILARYKGHRWRWFRPICWGLGILALLLCFTPALQEYC